jgi:hypothetical protein
VLARSERVQIITVEVTTPISASSFRVGRTTSCMGRVLAIRRDPELLLQSGRANRTRLHRANPETPGSQKSSRPRSEKYMRRLPAGVRSRGPRPHRLCKGRSHFRFE